MKNDVSRRTIARSAAWTIPVIAIGVAAPQAAASQTQQTLDELVFNNTTTWSPAKDTIAGTTSARVQWYPQPWTTANVTVQVFIDEVLVDTSGPEIVSPGGGQTHVLQFSKSGLAPGVHEVRFVASAPGYTTIVVTKTQNI